MDRTGLDCPEESRTAVFTTLSLNWEDPSAVIACFLRAFVLQLRLLWRLTGPLTPIVLAVLIGGVWLQEPAFFRQDRLDLAWPFVFAAADVLSGSIVVLVAVSPRGLIRQRLARSLAALVFGITGLLLFVVGGVSFDLMRHAPTPWAQLPALATRHILLWLPIVVLAQSPVLARAILSRGVVVALAFAVLTWSLPLSLSFTVVDKFLPSALALGGAFVTITASEH